MAKLDKHSVLRMTRLDERELYRKMAGGTFPRPVSKLPDRGFIKGRSLWNREDVMAWRNRRAGGQGAA